MKRKLFEADVKSAQIKMHTNWQQDFTVTIEGSVNLFGKYVDPFTKWIKLYKKSTFILTNQDCWIHISEIKRVSRRYVTLRKLYEKKRTWWTFWLLPTYKEITYQ